MANIPQIALRATQFVFTLLVLALVGDVIDDAFAGNPGGINWAMAVAAFSGMAVLYTITATFIESLAIPIVLKVVDGLLTLFTLIAGIVLAAQLGVHSCGNKSYLASNHLTNGAHNMGQRCHELQASCAFFWFLFAAYAGSLFLDFVGGSGTIIRASRRGGPSMSQV